MSKENGRAKDPGWISTRAVVVFDTEVAFDPAKEQLDAPAQSVNQRHRQRRDGELVGQKAQSPLRLGGEVTAPAQQRRKGRPCFGQSRFAKLVAAHGGGRHRQRALPGKAPVVFGPRDEERPRPGDQVQPLEIQVTAIDHIKGTRLEAECVEPAHVVLAGPGDVQAGGNGAAQIDLGVQFDAGFGAAEVGPGKKRQRKIDSRGVQGIDRFFQLQPEVFACIEASGLAHERLRQVRPQPPVPLFVGFRQSGFGDRLAKTQRVKRLGFGVQTGGDVPQSFAPGQLRKGHADELLTTTEMPHPRLGLVTFDQTVERLAMDKVEDLRQHETARIHGLASCRGCSQNSNASHPLLSPTRSFYVSSKTLKFS